MFDAYPPTMPSFEVLGENCKALTCQLFKAYVEYPDDDLPASLLLVTEEGIAVVGLPPFTNDEEKSHVAGFVIPAQIRSSGAHAVGFAATCWTAPWGDKPVEERVRPSEHPDRSELVALYLSNGDQAAAWNADLRRRPDKRPLLTPWKRQHCGSEHEFGGIFLSAINGALAKNLQAS